MIKVFKDEFLVNYSNKSKIGVLFNRGRGVAERTKLEALSKFVLFASMNLQFQSLVKFLLKFLLVFQSFINFSQSFS